MSWYIGIVIWILFCWVTINLQQFKTEEIVCGKTEYRTAWGIALIIVLPLIWFATNREMSFGDTYMYRKMFEEMPNNISAISSYMSGVQKDKGFYLVSFLIKTAIGEHYRVYFFIMATFQMICVVKMMRKYSEDFSLGIFVFVATADYYSFMQNGVRQFMAVSILLFGANYLFERKYIKYILVVLLASTMHLSALLMIPIMFIVQGKAWNKKTILLLIAALIAIAYIDQFTGILDNMLAETQYTNVVSDWQSWQDEGTNPLRVAIYAIPMILSLFGMKYIKASNSEYVNVATNMSIVTVGIFVISMFTSGIFIGRLPIYTSIYSMSVLLPWEIDNMFTKQSAYLIKIVLICAFLVFYYYQMHIAWGVI